MDGYTLTLVLLALSSLWYFFYWRPRTKIRAAGRLIPGPKALPIIGNVMLLWVNRRLLLPVYKKLHTDYGPVVRVWLGSKLMVFLNDPEDIQCVLGNMKNINRDSIFAETLMPFFGNGLLSNRDDVWKLHRKLMTPMFHTKVLESYVEIFGEKSKILVEKLDKVADGREFDIYDPISLCTLDTICETVIGMQTDTQHEGHSAFRTMIYDAMEFVNSHAAYPWQLVTWIYPFTIDAWKARPIIKNINMFGRDIIHRKMAAYRQGIRKEGIKMASGKIVTSFLDMLIEASETQGSILNEQEMQDETKTLAVTGLETTAVSMCTLLLLIAIHPEWQDALFAEMSDVFADDMNRPATNQDISKMPILDRVIRETLRIFPVASMQPREITEDTLLPSGYTLPAGSSGVVVGLILHRNVNVYCEPDKFLPDRWLLSNADNMHPYSYLPFGAGTRNCIGQKYAHLQMKSVLSQLIRRYKVLTDLTMSDLEKLEMSIALRLGEDGYRVRLEKRA